MPPSGTERADVWRPEGVTLFARTDPVRSILRQSPKLWPPVVVRIWPPRRTVSELAELAQLADELDEVAELAELEECDVIRNREPGRACGGVPGRRGGSRRPIRPRRAAAEV